MITGEERDQPRRSKRRGVAIFLPRKHRDESLMFRHWRTPEEVSLQFSAEHLRIPRRNIRNRPAWPTGLASFAAYHPYINSENQYRKRIAGEFIIF